LTPDPIQIQKILDSLDPVQFKSSPMLFSLTLQFTVKLFWNPKDAIHSLKKTNKSKESNSLGTRDEHG